MKTALVTTSINVPKVLKLYRQLDPDVALFVTGDLKTPDEGEDFCNSLKNCLYLGPQAQKHLNYKSSELIGWNTDSRRNIAVLEAVKSGAEVIISVDDDMIPIESCPLLKFGAIFDAAFDGLQFGCDRVWFDAGGFTIPQAEQRGLPPDSKRFAYPYFATSAKIGVAQGVILGVPDTSATEAIGRRPFIHSASDILRNGFVVHPGAYAVFNSQWTAFRAELAPAFMQHYATQQRNTDILASMLMRRLMAERELYTYFGPPMAFHAREPRPLFNDLRAEIYGLEHIQDWADYLHRAPIAGRNMVDDCRALVGGCGFLSQEFKDCAFAYYEDMESVL